MENFTAIYVYANATTVTITFPSTGLAVYELFKTTGGAQTFYTQVLYPMKRGTVNLTLNIGVYGWHADPAVTVTVSANPNVTVSTRAKAAKDPWPTPPPPPPPTKFGSLSLPMWNKHYDNSSLRLDEFMYALGGAAQPIRGPEPAARRGGLSMIGVHVAATRRGPAYGAIGEGELTFPTDMMAIGHRLTHLRGAEYTQFLLGETATRDHLIDAVTSAAHRLAPGGVFVLSFAGHGGQMPDLSYDEVDGTDEIWQLYDALLYDDELGYLLSCFDPSVHCVVIADCCHAGGMIDRDAERAELADRWGGLNAPAARAILPLRIGESRRRVPSASTALIAATSAHQAKINTPTTQFGRVLEELLASGRAPTYRALDSMFQRETPGNERANVWCSNDRTWDMPPIGR